MIFKNLIKTYKNNQVLNIDNIEFQEGLIYSIIGSNGSGKSTLGKILSGVIKTDSNKNISNKDITYMEQNSFGFNLSVLNNCLINSKNRKKDLVKAKELLKVLNMSDLGKSNASKLSGGETSKMALVRILLNPTKYVILDEPTSAMDIDSMLKAEELIKDINKKNHITFIIITHSISEAKRISDRVIFLKDGKIIEKGNCLDVLNNPKTIELKNFIELYSK